MTEPYSHLYNAVILPMTPLHAPAGVRYQVSANRNDRGTCRYLSPAWSEAELRTAFLGVGTSEAQFRGLLQGNRRAGGGRDRRRLLYTQAQLEEMGLVLDLPQPKQMPKTLPSAENLAVFSASTTA